MTESNSELHYRTIGELQASLAKGEISSHEITSILLKRIARSEKLNAFISMSEEKALESAALADKLQPQKRNTGLCGIPIAIKDIIHAKGYKTTAASKILSNFIAPYDATVISNLVNSGAFCLGKTNLDEFAMGSSNENSAFGAVRNPWNIDYVPGGSSGGSAVAVAAGLAPAALGTDTGGSIRQPAALCGIHGIKPTYGRVSRYGIVAFASSLDQVGVFARCTRDLAVVLQAISGYDKRDSTSVVKDVPDWPALCKVPSSSRPLAGLKIGIPREYFIAGMSPEVESSVRSSIDQLAKLGADVLEISLPHTEAAVAVYYILAPAEASSNLARYDGVRYGLRIEGAKDLQEMYFRSRSEGFGAEVKRRILVGTYVLSTGYYDAYYLRAQKVRRLIAKDFENAFKQCDVIACPASPTAAFKIGEKTEDPLAMYLNDVFTIPVNLAGLPGMSVPCGMASDGLPIGLQLIAKAWDESSLFKTASAYESVSDWHSKRPKETWLS